jgi:hypothetical protein
MDQNYDGLPAAGSMEQAIILAQLLILRDLERRPSVFEGEWWRPRRGRGPGQLLS